MLYSFSCQNRFVRINDRFKRPMNSCGTSKKAGRG
jgi:hypothetical protein